MAPKRTGSDLPDYLTDPAINRYISGLLEAAVATDGHTIEVEMTNTLIRRAVEQTRAYHPEQYQGGNGGENAPWADRIGA